jgi:O-antigen ligase
MSDFAKPASAAGPWSARAGLVLQRGWRSRLNLLGAWLLGVLILAPALTRPEVAIALVAAIVAVGLAWKSIAYPLAAAGVPPLVDAIVGSNPLPKGGFTFLFSAWIALAVFFAVIQGRTHVAPRALMRAPIVLSLALLGLMLLRLSSSPAEAYGSMKVQLYIADVLIILVGAVFVGASRRDLELFIGLTFVILAIGALLFIFDLLSGSAHMVAPERFSLTAQEYPIYLGRASAEGVLIAIYLILAAKRTAVRLYAFAITPALLVALIAAGSRGPLVAFVFGLFALLALVAAGGRARRRLIPVVGALLIAIVFVPLLVPASSIGRSLSTILGSASGLSSNGRSELWSQAYAAFGSHVFAGVGWGGFAALNPEELYPHNLLLEVAVELGIFGAAIVVGILVGATRRLMKVWRAARGTEKLMSALLLSLLLTALVNAMFSGAIQDNGPVWLWAGLGVGMSARLANRQVRSLRRRRAPYVRPDRALG